jgi:nucleotidyltransferase substrate binding protein (TIGR01987 family)
MTVNIEPLAKAITRLEEGLARYQRDVTDTQIRDGLIQRFEFTYEVAHRTLKRFLESVSPTPQEYNAADFNYIIRSANEQGLLLKDWPAWKGYRDMRAKTSHTYDEETALEVVAGITPFLDEARFLRDQLRSRLA